MLLAGEFEASKAALERSTTLARLVGDGQIDIVISHVLAAVYRESLPLTTMARQKSVVESKRNRIFAFCPSMDNVNAKMNTAGIPPRIYARALLHRAILFTDGIYISPSTIGNSSVFVDEVLFQGELDMVDEVLLHRLILIMPEYLRNRSKKITSYRRTRHSNFIFELVSIAHLEVLDAYFDLPENQSQIRYYDESSLSVEYTNHLQNQVAELHRHNTTNHLIKHWHHRGRKASAPAVMEHQYAHSVREVVHDLVTSFAHLINQFKGRSPTRSQLYRYADLFEEAENNPQKSLEALLPEVHKDIHSSLISARERIINRPWMYGSLCHELFDIPYQANLVLSLASLSMDTSYLFLEQSDVPSWQHTVTVRAPADNSGFVVSSSTPDINSSCSALLLSQMPKEALLQARDTLAGVREKIAADEALSEEDLKIIQAELAACNNGPAQMSRVQVKTLVELEENTKSAARALLQHCIFIVRRGEALDPVYEEAQLSVPGLFAMKKI